MKSDFYLADWETFLVHLCCGGGLTSSGSWCLLDTVFRTIACIGVGRGASS